MEKTCENCKFYGIFCLECGRCDDDRSMYQPNLANECGDKRFEIIAKAKKDIIESTNIETSIKEMDCLDNFLFRCWQMGWLKQYEE